MRFEKTSSTFFFLRQTVTCVCTTFFCSPQQDDPAAFFRKPPTDRLLDIARPLERLSRRKGCDTVRSRSPTRGRRPPTWGRGSNLVARLVGDVNRVLSLNAVVSVVIGGLAFATPHKLVQTLFGQSYDHFQHELVRMYGAMTLAQGWVVFKTRTVGDGLIRRAICEAFCLAYGLQAVALLRAQLASPESHTLLNLIGCAVFATLAAFYGYCRWFKTIKVFELPGTRGQSLA